MFWRSIKKKFLSFFDEIKPYLTFISLSISFFYFTKVFKQKIPTVKFSYFLLGLSKNLITELYVAKNTIRFRGPTNSWYQTDCSLMSAALLAELIRNNSQVKVNNVETVLQAPTAQNLVICSLGFLLLAQLKKFLEGGIKKQIRNRGLPRKKEEEERWKNWVGADQVRLELEEAVEGTISHHGKFKKLRVRPKRCFLILGPSGSGKTSLVQSLALHFSLPLLLPPPPSLASHPSLSSSLLLLPSSSYLIQQSAPSLSSLVNSFFSEENPFSENRDSIRLLFEKGRKGEGIILIDDFDLKEEAFLGELAREIRKMKERGNLKKKKLL
jgi:ATPase family associated with various cellular activities (AAA)